MIKANVFMPTDPNTPIRRMFAVRDRHDVIVAISPGTEMRLVQQIGQFVPHYTVVALSDAAVKYLGDKNTGSIPLYKLVPVTLNNLKNVTPIAEKPLMPEPPLTAVYRRLR